MSELTFAFRLADAADAVTTPYVGAAPAAHEKVDGSPVTAADVAVEETLLALVQRERSQDGYLGEEVGPARDGRRRWIVDGIDGTAAFVVGRPEWATLIGLEVDAELVLGVASSPGLDRRWWATSGGGAWRGSLSSGDEQPVPLAVSRTSRLADALVEAWVPPYQERPDAAALVATLAAECRSGGDLPWATPRPNGQRPSWGSGHPAGALLVAAGLLDGFVMLAGGPWDYAATAVIVEEAGGRFTDIKGRRRIDSGSAVFTNGSIHEALLAVLSEGR